MTADEDRDITWVDHVGAVNLFVRLFCELAIIGGVGVWGWRATNSSFETVQEAVVGIAAALMAPLVWAIVWGAFVAPKAKRRLPDPVRFVVEMALFAGFAFALSAVDLPVVGITLGGLAALTSLLMIRFGQRGK
jgi:hypothetical protein